QHPAVEPGHQAIALRMRDEMRRQNEPAVGLAHPHQHLRVRAPDAAHGDDRLTVERETILGERAIEARDPMHAARAQLDVAVACIVDLQAVASFLLGEVAGGLGATQERRRRARIETERYETNTQARLKVRALPLEIV